MNSSEDNSVAKPSPGRWRFVRRVLVSVAVLATLVAIFYAEENWRGKRAWEKCKRELEAKGMDFNWNALIPPPVPDGQNFFKAPKMAEWFARIPGRPPTNDFPGLLAPPNSGVKSIEVDAVQTEQDARNHLAWSDPLQPDFELIREALSRPYARIEGDYSQPMTMPMVNFAALRTVTLILAQRTRCYLMLGEPDKALKELTLIHDLRRILKGEPTGKPMTLVAAMIDVAITGHYVSAVADGLRMNAWREQQLVELQRQLSEINLTPMLASAFQYEQVASAWALETLSRRELVKLLTPSMGPPHETALFFTKYAPRGWFYQNMVSSARLARPFSDAFNVTNQTVSPHNLDESTRAIQDAIERNFRHNFLTSLAMPNFVKAVQTFARNQTSANEAAVACGLERYRLAKAEYPETLNALAPQFITKVPQDVIGQPFKYRRTDRGKFLLYSVGWNETDESGETAWTKDTMPRVDVAKGDWAWPPAK